MESAARSLMLPPGVEAFELGENLGGQAELFFKSLSSRSGVRPMVFGDGLAK